MVVNLTRLPIAQQLAIKALLETGKSERHTARLSGVSRETVRAVKVSNNLDPQAVDRIKSGLAGKLYNTADRSIDSITNDKLKHSSAVQAMTTAAIAIDKARLIEGKATSRTEYVNASDKEINDEIARLEGELASWEGGQIVNAEGCEGHDTTPIGQPAPQTVEHGVNGAD